LASDAHGEVEQVPRLALIDVTPGKRTHTGFASGDYVTGTLSAQYHWHIPTPSILQLRQGKVVRTRVAH
jgi:hypothetical protein